MSTPCPPAGGFHGINQMKLSIKIIIFYKTKYVKYIIRGQVIENNIKIYLLLHIS